MKRGELLIFVRELHWIVEELLARHNEILNGLIGRVEYDKYVDVALLDLANWEVVLGAKRFDLDGEVPTCFWIVCKKINELRAPKCNRNLKSAFKSSASTKNSPAKAVTFPSRRTFAVGMML